MKHAASYLNELGAKTVVVKGGNRLEGTKAIDVFYDGTDYKLFEEVDVIVIVNPVLMNWNILCST